MKRLFTLAAGLPLALTAFGAQVPTPANPEVDSYQRRGFMYELKVSIPTVDVKGNALDKDKLYYRLYIDGKPFTFTKDTYSYIDEEMDMVPWDYQDSNGNGYDIMKWWDNDNQRRIYLYSAASEIGVESVYVTTAGEGVSARYNYNTVTGEGTVGDIPEPDPDVIITELPASAWTSRYTLDTWIMAGILLQHYTWSGKFDDLGRDNNDIYIKDICGQYRFGTYVKGTLIENGTILRIPTGQHVFHQDEDLDNGLERADVYLRAVRKNEADESVDLMPEAEYVDFNVDADGVISLSGDYGLAYVGHDGYLLAKNLGYVYAPFDIYNTTVYPPANIKPVTYKLTYSSEPGEKRNAKNGLNVVIDNASNAVYIQGLAKTMTETWIKGSIEGDSFIFPSKQYLGTYTNDSADTFAVYFNGADATDEYGLFGRIYATKDNITFKYDKDTGIFRSDDSVTETIGTVNPLSHMVAPELEPAEVKEFAPATPADPIVKSWQSRGFVYELVVDVPSIDTDGELLDTDALVYRLYLNGSTEPFVFDLGSYNYIEEPMTDIPWNYQDQGGVGYDIMKWGSDDTRRIYFYEKPSTIAIESQYTKNNDPRTSRRYVFDVNTKTGSYDTPDGIMSISGDKEVIETVVTGLDGKKVSNPAKGIYIVTERYSDGTRKSVKRVMR